VYTVYWIECFTADSTVENDFSGHCLLHAGFFLDLYFNLEDGGDMFFLNIV
jgi:hypothetical protein